MAESLASATAPAGLDPGAQARNAPASYRMIGSFRPSRRTSRLAFGSGGNAAGMIQVAGPSAANGLKAESVLHFVRLLIPVVALR